MPKFYRAKNALTTANYQTAADAYDTWQDEVLTGSPPVHSPIGAGDLERIEIGLGLVTLLGGPPGAGHWPCNSWLMVLHDRPIEYGTFASVWPPEPEKPIKTRSHRMWQTVRHARPAKQE